MSKRAPRYVVAPSDFHHVTNEGISRGGLTRTDYYHLMDGTILAQTIIGHSKGSPADVYESHGRVIHGTRKNGKEYDKFLISEQDHFKEPRGGRGGKGTVMTELVKTYWPKFVETTAYSDAAAKDRMKKFWEWMVEQGYYVKKGTQKATQKRTGSSPLVLPIPSAFIRG